MLLVAMAESLVTHVSLFKSLLLTDKLCWTFGTLCRATRDINLQESQLAKRDFENLLELQSDQRIQEHQEEDLRQFMDEILQSQ